MLLSSVLLAITAISYINTNLWLSLTSFLVLIAYLLTFHMKTLRISLATLPRDIRAGIKLLGAKYYLYNCKRENLTAAKIFKQIAKKYPKKVAFYIRDEEWTYERLDQFSNKVANCFASMGYKSGDEVALMMNTRPEFVGFWLGLAKTGIVTAFINTNQRHETLIHSITTCNCKAIIFEDSLVDSINEIVPLISERNISLNFYNYGEGIKENSGNKLFRPMQTLMSDASAEDPINLSKGNFNDKLYYIFTSGTTGLPKAAVIRNHRYIWLGLIVRKMFHFRLNDVLYLTLPLYHNNAGTIGTSQSVLFGTTIALREKFSASSFWKDCIKYKCTCAMYIGELCRYLLAQPPSELDKQHSVRIMFGNGLRPQIWEEFKERFSIPQIGEFYGSSEGNANVANYDFKPGACGIIPMCIPPLCKLIYPVAVIKVDPITGDYVRDSKGLCVMTKPGETGEIVAKIHESDPSKAYPGYASAEATNKKILHNVFKKGDKAFLSGDLMEMDEYGYLYFRDRTGDTFRWKGENVSTNEVEAVVQMVTQMSDSVVFGVNIGNCEGKAGMAVIAAKPQDFDMKELAAKLTQHLPLYAVPLFIRFVDSIELTGSFKLSKVKFEKTGFDPNIISDSLYFLDRKLHSYVPLDIDLYKRIQSGEIAV